MSEIPDEPASVVLSGTTSADAALIAAEAFLAGCGATDIPHPGGTLLAHLVRVRERLAAWGAAPEVQLAGLCHAAYGTDGFDRVLLGLPDRARLRAVVGDRAEALVYLYASCDREVSYPRFGTEPAPVIRDRFTGADVVPAPEELRAFLDITAANELDVFANNADLAERYGPGLHRLLSRVRDRLSPAAWQAVAADLPAE